MTTLFWTNNPKILIANTNVLPKSTMTFEEKNNSISRLIIVLTLIGFCLTQRVSFLIVGILTLAIIFTIYTTQTKLAVEGMRNKSKHKNNNELTNTSSNNDVLGNISLDKNTNEVANIITAPVQLTKVPLSDFNPINKKNPMGNVLLTEINNEPNRKSAPPSFSPDVHEKINTATKKQTQYLNPGIKNTDKKLYGDLWDNFQFDTEFMRNFYSTANTRVANDQGAFAQFLYGDMPSGKSSGPDGSFARVQDNPRYNLY